MNCGFEDVRILKAHLQQHSNLSDAISSYSTSRRPSLQAIQHLALRNYHEMASSVVNPFYLLRKKTDALLARILGESIWCPLYSMVTFRHDIPYDQVVKREAKQTRILNGVLTSVALLTVGAASWTGFRMYNRR